jgi:hypothetical protein
MFRLLFSTVKVTHSFRRKNGLGDISGDISGDILGEILSEILTKFWATFWATLFDNLFVSHWCRMKNHPGVE